MVNELPPVLPHLAVLEGLAYAAFEMHYKATMRPDWLLPRTHWVQNKGARTLWTNIVATLLLAEPGLSNKHAELNADDPVTVARKERMDYLKAERDACGTPEERKRVKDRQFSEIYGIPAAPVKFGDYHKQGFASDAGIRSLLDADFNKVERTMVGLDYVGTDVRPMPFSIPGNAKQFSAIEEGNRKTKRAQRRARKINRKS